MRKLIRKKKILKSINFWIDYHKKGYNNNHKLPVDHILIVLDKIKHGIYE